MGYADDEESSPFVHVLGKQFQVRIPFVANDLSARKTSYGDNLQGYILP